MPEMTIEIHFLSDWHTGSGFGDGAISDAILNRDADGLPYIPGRAIKGALREGAWRLGLCRHDLAGHVDWLWGASSQSLSGNQPGRLRVGMGELPQDMRTWLLSLNRDEREIFVRDLTILRAQTSLDEDRRVVAHSLRSMECGIPGVIFLASLTVDAPELDAAWLNGYLQAVCAAVKSIGAGRSRGLGRARFRILENHADVKLPCPCPLSPGDSAKRRGGRNNENI